MAYFVKLDSLPRHKILFQQSLTVMEDLYQKGITFIPKIIKTKQNQLCSSFATAVVGMFEWLEGENRETDGTKPMEYQMLCQVYPLTRPGWSIPTVSFSDAAAQTFYRYWDTFKHMPQTAAVREVLNLLQERSGVLARCARRLNQVAAWCRAHPGKLYLTHGDAGGNFLVKGHGSTERYYIVDWDEVMYAPLERDAWVMGCRAWARQLFNDTLQKKHIPYTLHNKRLAFYCYHMCFFYLCEFLEDLLQGRDVLQRLAEYCNDGWIWERVQFADQQ